MPTAAQTAANRKNALSSSGPRTEAGKQAASRNAVRHGILASVIPHTTPGYEDLLIGLYSSLNPLDEPQRMLVDQIAVTAIRLNRIIAAEQKCLEAPKRPAEVNGTAAERSAIAAYLESNNAALAMRYEVMLTSNMHRLLRQYKEMKADWNWKLARNGKTPYVQRVPIQQTETDVAAVLQAAGAAQATSTGRPANAPAPQPAPASAESLNELQNNTAELKDAKATTAACPEGTDITATTSTCLEVTEPRSGQSEQPGSLRAIRASTTHQSASQPDHNEPIQHPEYGYRAQYQQYTDWPEPTTDSSRQLASFRNFASFRNSHFATPDPTIHPPPPAKQRIWRPPTHGTTT